MGTLGQQAVGNIVKVPKAAGGYFEVRITHQGLPSSLYDASCNGTWCLLDDIYANRTWDESGNDYNDSDINAWLNNTSNGFLSLLDLGIREAIKQVKIPYSDGSNVVSGANGLSCKVFLYGGYELGWTTDVSEYFPIDGAKLDYFLQGTSSAADAKRKAKLNDAYADYFTRSTRRNNTNGVWNVDADGSYGRDYSYNSRGIRPGFILPTSLLVSDDGTVSTNEPPTAPGSISVSGVVASGTATITLTAATDPDGTIASYRYERSVDSGSWTQFADVNSLTQTDSVSGDWGTVAYRACAVDDAGEADPERRRERHRGDRHAEPDRDLRP